MSDSVVKRVGDSIVIEFTVPIPPVRRTGSVYVLWDGSCVKIGKTFGCVKKRVKELQTGSSRRLVPLIGVLLPCAVSDVEKRCKDRLKAHNTSGEWFRVSKQDAVDVVIDESQIYVGRKVVVYSKSAQSLVEHSLCLFATQH